MKVASFFAGCGGLDYAFHHNEKFEVVFSNDFDDRACETYEHNFKFKPLCKDIRKIDDIPDCDVMLGGFPCQGFSMAGLRQEDDERNTLYLELVRLLKKKKPKYFLFENVKGLLSMGGYETPKDKKEQTGRVFKMIVKDLEGCGYKVSTKLFKVKYYNMPQNRERIIFFGIREDLDVSFEWAVAEDTITKTLRDAIGDLPVEQDPTIQHLCFKNKIEIKKFCGHRLLEWDKVSNTITCNGGDIHPSETRNLTVRECARIQGFPDQFWFKGAISRQYKQIGNAVPVQLGELLCKMIADIKEQDKTQELIKSCREHLLNAQKALDLLCK